MKMLLVTRASFKEWDESQHPRVPAGEATGGQFTETRENGIKDNLLRATPEEAVNLADYYIRIGKLTFDEAMQILADRPKPTARANKPKEGNWKDAISLSEVDTELSDLPEKAGTSRWAVRYTENWENDLKRGYSFAEWGVSAYGSKADAERDFPKAEIVYSRELGGYMPRLAGLSAFTDSSAVEAYQEARRWFKNKGFSDSTSPYAGLVIFEAKHAGIGPDNEDLVLPVKGGRVIKVRINK